MLSKRYEHVKNETHLYSHLPLRKTSCIDSQNKTCHPGLFAPQEFELLEAQRGKTRKTINPIVSLAYLIQHHGLAAIQCGRAWIVWAGLISSVNRIYIDKCAKL